MELKFPIGAALAALALALPLCAEDAAKPAESAPAAAEPAESAKPVLPAVQPNDAPGSLKKGNQLLDEEKWEEAAHYFEGIGEQVKSNGRKKREPWRLVGWSTALIHLQQFKKAEELARKALEIDSLNGPAWNNLASAQVNQGKRDEAIATYQKAIEALKAAGKDFSKLEANLAALQTAVEEGKPKKVREAEAKAKAEAQAAGAAAPAATSPTAETK